MKDDSSGAVDAISNMGLGKDQGDLDYVGKIAGVFGVKGWVKVISYTQPEENIFTYLPWFVRIQGDWVELLVEQSKPHKNAWIARLRGVCSRDDAEQFKLKKIAVGTHQFKALANGEFYWRQLIGLRVLSSVSAEGTALDEGSLIDLGYVHQMLETGANDVIDVRADSDSFDSQDRVIPYIPGVYVDSVDIESGRIMVAWHPED